MKKRTRILLPMLVTLAVALSMVMAVPVYAADVALTKGVTPTTPNIYRLGDIIHYTMSIRNISDIMGTNEDIVVEAVWDVLPDGTAVNLTVPALPYTLAPGESQSYTYNWTATVTGTVSNKFYASGYQISTGGRHDAWNMNTQKQSSVIDPAIQIVKYVNGDDANSSPGPAILIGGSAIFTYQVTNIGLALPNTSPADNLYPVVVVDDNGTAGNISDDFSPTYTGGDDGDGRLNPSETWYYSYNGTAAAGQHENIATATGTPYVGSNVSDTDPANYVGVKAKIDISPLESTNKVGESHNLTACVYVDYGDGGGYVLYTGSTNINFTKTAGVGSLNATSVPTSTGCAQVTLTTTEAGGSTVTAQAAFSVDGAAFDISTDGTGDNSGPAQKTWGCEGEIEISKKDDSGVLLAGACFNITPNPYDGGTLKVCDGDANDKDTTDGVILLEDVPCGNYTVTEDTAPQGYVAVTGSQNVEVTSGSKETVEFINAPCTGSIEILKRDDAGAPLAGACFNVTPNPYNGNTRGL
jgi:uncharacterized repeat protein (TIGR01451 family)